MSPATRHFCKIFAVVVLLCFCIPSMANTVTNKSNLAHSSPASLRGPHSQVSANWVAYWKSDDVFKDNDKDKDKPKPQPKHHPHSQPIAVADGDPSSLALLAVGLSGLLVTAVVARTRPKTRT
jgi:hypothetical protein